MKLLNLGCGGKRPSTRNWVNIDQLKGQLPPDQWEALAHEKFYVEHDIATGLPFADNDFDGILAAHVIEHFSVQPALKLMKECLRILKPGGVLMVSVPDAQYFRHVHPQDHGAQTWPDLYGVFDPPNPLPNWATAALYFEQHFQVFSEDTLWCALMMAGFSQIERAPKPPVFDDPVRNEMASLLDRIPFSLVMVGRKE